jgi:hypothetical protein
MRILLLESADEHTDSLIGTAPLASIYALRIFGPTSPSPCRARWPP